MHAQNQIEHVGHPCMEGRLEIKCKFTLISKLINTSKYKIPNIYH
jgi:hypothetical protein